MRWRAAFRKSGYMADDECFDNQSDPSFGLAPPMATQELADEDFDDQPDDVEVGRALFALGDYDQAIMSLTEAAEFNPDCPFSQFWLGRAFIEKGNYSQAVLHLEQAVKLLPGPTVSSGTPSSGYAISKRLLYILKRPSC